MVFAKNEHAASFLSRAWRERDSVSKVYLARVHDWPPYHEKKLLHGTINVPLAPSDERLKWKVVLCEDDPETTSTVAVVGAKPSTTEWKVVQNGSTIRSLQDHDDGNAPLLLELYPITGRTHQLRIHCAHVGSGIVGDSLYGRDKIEFDPTENGSKLYLHAHKLSFPHPSTLEICEYVSTPAWCV
jgi:23S rRNA-/tRNA-specific pseudouridylate synthase